MEVQVPRATRARTLGVAAVAAFVGYSILLVESDSEPADGGAWVYVAIAAVVAAAVWWFAVAKPLERATGNTPAKVGMVVGIIAVLTSVFFWAGYEGLLGAGALVLGMEGSRRAGEGQGRARMAKAATILGLIGVAVFCVTTLAWVIADLT